MDDIYFDVPSHHFYYAGADVTDGIARQEKMMFAGFNVEKDNLRLYNEKNPGAGATGDTTIWGNFWDQIFTDPLAAPFESADKSIASVTGSVSGKLLLAAGIIGLGVYFKDDLKKILS